MSRDAAFYIVDIFIAYDKIMRYSESFKNGEELLYDEIRWDAVLRELEIIGEAVNRLLNYRLIDDSYRIVVDFRNRIVHGYFGIDPDIVWDVITTHLSRFIESFSILIKQSDISIAEAIVCAKEDFSAHPKTVAFLEKLFTTFSDESNL
jgi:uncharacterized protein with HEPN domain